MFRSGWGLVLCSWGIAMSAVGQPYGIADRVPNNALVIDFDLETVPDKLSDIPALLAAGLGEDQSDEGIYPYRPSSELWSDGALKSRFVALPGTTQIALRELDDIVEDEYAWDFPVGTIIIKNFLLPQDFRDPEGTAKRVETRLMVRTSFDWEGYTYEWNDAETDAFLLPELGRQRPFTLVDESGADFSYQWQYPSRTTCFVCHTAAANTILGLNFPQLNHAFTYPDSGISDNQLRTMDHIGLFEDGLPKTPDQLPRSPDATDASASIADRAQSYLQANCSHCHRPGGGTGVTMDFRWGVPLAERNIVNTPPVGNPMGIFDAFRFAPGEPERSVIPARMGTPNWLRMPPEATSRVHHEAVALVRAWIADAGDPGPPHTADQNGDNAISLSELLRVIQFFNTGAYHCAEGTEDGYAPGSGAQDCTRHNSDYNPADWQVDLSELLRLIQLFNTGAYRSCDEGEDGFCPG